jgi:uncharacterized membrane protein YphA (DoxX/SURF4 family)
MVYDGAMIDPAIATWLAGAFALLFASAAVHKTRDLAQFAQVLRAYRVLPARLNLSWPVPLAELSVAAALLIPVTRGMAALSGAVLMLLYALAIAVNLGRGRRELACGCGGADERRPIAAWMVGRNLLLAVVLSSLTLPYSVRPLQLIDLVTVTAGVAVAALLYMSADTLLGRIAPRTALWEQSR